MKHSKKPRNLGQSAAFAEAVIMDLRMSNMTAPAKPADWPKLRGYVLCFFLFALFEAPSVKAGIIRICTQQREAGTTTSLAGANVRCYDEDYGTDELMNSSITTSADGCASIIFSDTDWDWLGNPDIYCVVEAAGYMSLTTNIKSDHKGTVVDFGIVTMYPDRVGRGDPGNTNGCGPAILPATLTDAFTRASGFGAYCNNHDLCNDNCREDKIDCDKEMRDLMYSSCNTEGPLAKVLACKAVAKGIYELLIAAGQDAYNAAQAKAKCQAGASPSPATTGPGTESSCQPGDVCNTAEGPGVCAPGSVAEGPGECLAGATFEDVPDIPTNEVAQTPTGVGTIHGRVADCPSTYTNNGATCGRGADSISAGSLVADCPSGYTNMGLTCYRGPSTYSKKCTIPIFGPKYGCRDGYTDNGCFCGRGASSLGPSSMECPSGYFRSSITARCHKNCPDGYTNTGETCFRGVSTLGIGSMVCQAGEERILARCFPKGGSCFANGEEQAGLCYTRCRTGFYGVGPVCWSSCDENQVDCAAACAKTSKDCALAVVDQIITPLVVAANVVTLGIAGSGKTVVEDTTNAVKVGNKFVVSSTKAGRLFLKAVNLLQSVQAAGLKTGANIVKRISHAKTGKPYKVVLLRLKVTSEKYQAMQNYRRAYAEDFAAQTSVEIKNMLGNYFMPATALFLKESWSDIQMKEMAAANGWQIADTALAAASIFDITGILGVVSAYAKPICGPVVAPP
eukprot:gene345-1723_t